MTRGLNTPFFPNPPSVYDQRHMSQLVQAFAVFARQVQTPGPWRTTQLEVTTDLGNVDRGQLTWNTAEDALDLTMGNGVVQQLGFETYVRVANETGSLIPNGTAVGIIGANGEIRVAPFLADGSMAEANFIGVTTCDIPDGEIRPVTAYGKVRGLDTSAFALGDALYVSPTVAGALTNVRPTAPDVVILAGIVTAVDATDGEILVEPRLPFGLRYGSFASTIDQTLSAINTATPVTFNVTESASGISRGTPNSRLVTSVAGYFQISASFQLTSNSASSKNVYFWLRKNGTDVTDTTRAVTLADNGAFFALSVVYDISLQAGEYIELMWASDSTDVLLDALTSSAFAPSAPSALVTFAQIQL